MALCKVGALVDLCFKLYSAAALLSCGSFFIQGTRYYWNEVEIGVPSAVSSRPEGVTQLIAHQRGSYMIILWIWNSSILIILYRLYMRSIML